MIGQPSCPWLNINTSNMISPTKRDSEQVKINSQGCIHTMNILLAEGLR
jgi:hypothetical protein